MVILNLKWTCHPSGLHLDPQDVAFIFPLEGSRLTAHRLILAAQCEGFKVQFYKFAKLGTGFLLQICFFYHLYQEVFHGVEAQEVEVVAATLEEFQLFLRSVYNLEVTWAALSAWHTLHDGLLTRVVQNYCKNV